MHVSSVSWVKHYYIWNAVPGASVFVYAQEISNVYKYNCCIIRPDGAIW